VSKAADRSSRIYVNVSFFLSFVYNRVVFGLNLKRSFFFFEAPIKSKHWPFIFNFNTTVDSKKLHKSSQLGLSL